MQVERVVLVEGSSPKGIKNESEVPPFKKGNRKNYKYKNSPSIHQSLPPFRRNIRHVIRRHWTVQTPGSPLMTRYFFNVFFIPGRVLSKEYLTTTLMDTLCEFRIG